ncbi:flagellar biosynthesis protein FliQ [Spinactinospora alkalitolerans]|uniref:Flagellar biosynthesis protein FliQ n=1 Tax=Spinactinospora alkalitolerans TaxID=687207 RepID=A0A852TS96_9ACTN|nr:flagellar biosynthesis protein FliQ [Spinactinospora alkalitolerans]
MSTSLAAVDFGQGLTNAWGSVISFVPKLAAFLVILILGWIIAKFIGSLVGKGLGRVGLDRALDRGGVGEYFRRGRQSASGLAGKLVYYIGVLIVLQLAFSVFGPDNPITQLINEVVAWIPRAIVALVIIVVAGIIAKAVRDIIDGTLGGLGYGRFLANLAGVFILALGIIAALNQIGVATTVTTPVLIAVLATVGGILVVGVGGGMVRPMQQRWSKWLDVAERETGRMRDEQSYQSGRSDAMRAPAREQEAPERQEAAAGRTGRYSAGTVEPGTGETRMGSPRMGEPGAEESGTGRMGRPRMGEPEEVRGPRDERRPGPEY